jgi:toxin ParE1/3/4
MVKIKISQQAQKDMRQIYDFVSKESLQNADSLVEKFIIKIDSLSSFPERGKIVKEFSRPSIREVSVYKFRIIYKVSPRIVRIITIHHSSRLIINNPFLKNYLK